MLDKVTLKDICEFFSTGDAGLDKEWIVFTIGIAALARCTIFDPGFRAKFLR